MCVSVCKQTIVIVGLKEIRQTDSIRIYTNLLIDGTLKTRIKTQIFLIFTHIADFLLDMKIQDYAA